jgi:hypothetical protein
MNVGKDFGKACDQAKANARMDGQARYLHVYNGVLWLGKSPVDGSHWMVTPAGEVIPVE